MLPRRIIEAVTLLLVLSVVVPAFSQVIDEYAEDRLIATLTSQVSKEPQPDRRLQTQIYLARVLAQRADRHPEDGKTAEKNYSEILASGALADEVRLRCLNDYGTLLLNRGDAAAAKGVFSEVQSLLSSKLRIAPADRARYLFNVANSEEKSGSRVLAVQLYEKSLRADPGNDDACAALTAVIGGEPGDEALSVVERRMAAHDTVCTEVMLKATLRSTAWQASPEYARLLTLWAENLADSNITATSFARRWRSLVYQGPVRAKFDQLIAVFGTPPPMVTTDNDAKNLAGEWMTTARDRRAYSNVLVNAAGQVSDDEPVSKLLALTSLAWIVDRSNVAAAIALTRAVGSAGSAPPQLDPVIGEVAAFCDSDQITDAVSSVRLHIVLADVFAQRELWDGPGTQNVIAQAQTALRAWERLTEDQQHDLPIPDLHARLAQAYARAGCFDAAIDHYFTAAASYLDLTRWDSAEPLLNAVATLPVDLAAPTVVRMARLMDDVDRSRFRSGQSLALPIDRKTRLTAWISADPELSGDDLQVTLTGDTVRLSGVVGNATRMQYLSSVFASWSGPKALDVRVAAK